MDGVKKCKHGRNFCCECHKAGDLNPVREALKIENQRIYPVGTTRDYESELAALREELANERGRFMKTVDQLATELAAAEQRNTAIIGKANKCKECGSDALFWFANNTNTSGIAEGRLRTNEVTCTFVLGCADCSATIRTVRADTIAERMTAALKPTESGASE